MRRRPLAALLALLLLATATAVPAATPPSPPLVEAYKNVTTFHEDLARIDRARDALEAEVARAPSLNALLLTGMFIGMAVGSALGSQALLHGGWLGVAGLCAAASAGAWALRQRG